MTLSRLLDMLLGRPVGPATVLHNGEAQQMEQSHAVRQEADAAIERHLRRERQAGRRPIDPARAIRNAQRRIESGI